MIALIDKNNIVQNVILASVEDATSSFGGVWVNCPEWVGIGMDINIPKPIIKDELPTEVSMRQARLALFQQGLLGHVQATIDALPEPNKTVTQISWDYATVVNRDDELVAALSAQLGLTSEALDALFTLAATL